MNFGGTNGIKGNLTHMNEIPFQALDAPNTTIWGTGVTSEGIDQNPALYDFIIAQNWRRRRMTAQEITQHLVGQAHRRYGLLQPDADVTKAWQLLAPPKGMYGEDVSVQDFTGVHNFPGGANWDFVGPSSRTAASWSYNAARTLCNAAGSEKDNAIAPQGNFNKKEQP